MSAHWAWFSSEDHIDTGRLCSAGFRRYPRSPTSTLVCSPPTPCLRRPRLRFPLPVAYLDASACSVPTTRALTNVSCVGDGSPALRKTGMGRGEARASQVPGPSSSYVPWSNTPPETPPSSPRRHVCKGVLLPSGKTGPSASGKTIGFGAACPMAHMFARLRIADHISGIVARLTTGSGGLTLGRAGFAPAGRQTRFREVIASSLPFDPHCLVALFFLSASERAPGATPSPTARVALDDDRVLDTWVAAFPDHASW